MKRILVVILILVMMSGCSSKQIIGTVEGPEWDKILIGDAEYIPESAVPSQYDIYSSADKDAKLGIIQSGDTTLTIYSVKGEESRDYIYVQWEWEGEIYIRKDIIKE